MRTNEEQPIGIKTLSRKIEKCEKRLNIQNEDDMDFEDVIIHNLENKKKIQQRSKIAEIKKHYKLGLVKQIDIENIDNIVEVIRYTCLWIEKNIGKLADALQTSVNSDLKLSSCIQLIKEVGCPYGDEFLTVSINTMIDIMFNTHPPIEEAVTVQDPKKVNKKLRKHILSTSKGNI